jgi:hypothetical protein
MMPPKLHLAGQRFGRLLALEEHGQDGRRAYYWRCVCDCGQTSIVRGSQLKTGAIQSCGCARVEASARLRTHGMTGTPLYLRWRAMLARTGYSRHPSFPNYGGRGIAVCERWKSFENFAADMGPTFSPELSLDRRDSNGDYSPENCHWATSDQQGRNRRNNHVIAWQSRSLTVADWAKLLGLLPSTIHHRLRRGWSVDRALTEGANPDVLVEIASSSASASDADAPLSGRERSAS